MHYITGLLHVIIGKVIVKCAQDGKSMVVQVHELSTFEGYPALPHELFRGASLLLEVKGKSYPVVFLDYQGTHVGHIHNKAQRLSQLSMSMCL